MLSKVFWGFAQALLDWHLLLAELTSLQVALCPGALSAAARQIRSALVACNLIETATTGFWSYGSATILWRWLTPSESVMSPR